MNPYKKAGSLLGDIWLKERKKERKVVFYIKRHEYFSNDNISRACLYHVSCEITSWPTHIYQEKGCLFICLCLLFITFDISTKPLKPWALTSCLGNLWWLGIHPTQVVWDCLDLPCNIFWILNNFFQRKFNKIKN